MKEAHENLKLCPWFEEWDISTAYRKYVSATTFKDFQRKCTSAEEAWTTLKDFQKKDSPNNRVSIWRKLMTKRLEEDGDVESHVNQMNELVHKLLALGEEFHVVL